MKTGISLLLAMLLVATLFTGCGEETTAAATTTNTNVITTVAADINTNVITTVAADINTTISNKATTTTVAAATTTKRPTTDHINGPSGTTATHTTTAKPTAGLFDTNETTLNVVDDATTQPEKPLYSFGVLSDIHISTASGDVYSSNSVAKFKNALQFYNEYGCDYTFISGDITSNGSNSEFAKYVEIRDQYKGDMTVLATTGNHEASSSRTYSNKITDATCIAYNIYERIGNHYFYYIENGKYTYWDLSQGKYTVETAPNVTIKDPSIVLPKNDVYIFLSILGDANNGAFWNESLQWIYETFETNKDKRCFVFEHIRAEYAEDIVNGVMTNDIYSSYVSGNQSGLYLKPLWRHGTWFPTTYTLESLFAHYTNISWFHGHSHHSSDTSKFVGYPGYSVGNIDSHFGDAYEPNNPAASANNTKWTWSIHVPSVVETRELDANGELIRNKKNSEGLIVDVYSNHIVLKYICFTTDKGATFINEFIETEVHSLDTTIDTIGEYTPPKVVVNNKQTYLINK